MMRQLSQREVQMLTDLSVELGEVNYIAETPILTLQVTTYRINCL